MKKLKIISLCFLISLLFIPVVKAVTSDYYYEPKNTESLQELINNNQDKISKIKTYVETNGIGDYFPLTSTESYVLAIQMSNIDNNFNVRLVNYTSFINGYKSATLISRYTSNQYGTSGGFSWPQTFYQRQFHFVNNEIEPVNTAILSSGNFGWSSITNCDLRNENCILDNSNWYFDTSYIKNDVKFFINNTYCNGMSGTCLYVPVKSDDTLYNSGEYISIKTLLDNLQLPVNPYKCILDANNLGGFRDTQISNISEYSIRITGIIPAGEYGYDGSFALKNSSIPLLNSPDLSVNVNINDLSDNPNQVPAAATYSWDNTTNSLIVSYSIGGLSNEDQFVDMVISVTPDSDNSGALSFFASTLNVFLCTPTNLDNDITYGYIDNNTGTTVSSDTKIFNFLNDSNSPDLSIFSNLGSLLPPGPVDSILTIPLQILNAINNWLQGEYCTPITVNLPFVNQNIQLQCMRTFYNDIGAGTFFEGVGTIASIVILIQYFVGLYNWVESHMQLSHQKFKAWGAGEV